MNLRVYIEKVAMVINGACMESQYFRIRRVLHQKISDIFGVCQDEWLMGRVEAASSRIFPGKRVHVWGLNDGLLSIIVP